MILPARSFEQREHLAMIAALPYFVLVAARRRRQPVKPTAATMIGLFAGVGLSLKPHFLIGSMLIELWLLVALRRDWRPLRAETLGLAAAVLIYLAAIVIFAPAYFTHILPELVASYQATSPPLGTILRGFTPALWLVMLIGFIPLHRALRRGSAPVAAALLLGGLGFALAWLLQHKGWMYQGLPATGCIALAFAALLIERGRRASPWLAMFAPGLLILPLATVMFDNEVPITPANDIAPALADLGNGDTFALISTAGAASWPALVDRNLRLSSRYGQYWMLRLLDGKPVNPAAVRLVDRAIRETAADFACLPPRIVVFLRIERGAGKRRMADHPQAIFMRDPSWQP